jgi:hypothetical protein
MFPTSLFFWLLDFPWFPPCHRDFCSVGDVYRVTVSHIASRLALGSCLEVLPTVANLVVISHFPKGSCLEDVLHHAIVFHLLFSFCLNSVSHLTAFPTYAVIFGLDAVSQFVPDSLRTLFPTLALFFLL